MDGTISENILARASGLRRVIPGDFVEARVDLAMAHESARLAIKSFREMGARNVWDPRRAVLVLDHRAPAECEETAGVHRLIRSFVREQGIPNFYDVGEGICHQLLPEKGHVRPGDVIVGADSHTPTGGAFGAFATGVGATDLAAVWATGRIWLRVPETIKVHVSGRFAANVGAMDLALHLVRATGAYGAEYRAIEHCGPAISAMDMGSRMTLCNLSTEMGAKAAMIEPDRRTLSYLARRGVRSKRPAVGAGRGARYESKLDVDAEKLGPMLACPHAVDNVKAVREEAGRTIDQAVIGGCTGGRLGDLAEAARILGGRKVHCGVRLIVVPASREVLATGIRSGVVGALVEAGAVLENPGCGPCLGAHQGVLAPDEVCISTTSRNFRGRMGSPEASIYLASPATVATSALKGKIAEPQKAVSR